MLTLAADGMVMTLIREIPEAPFTPADPVPAADVSAFAGTWKAAWLCGDGTVMAADSAQALDSWSMLFGSEDQTMTVTGTHAVYFGNDEDFTFANGRLENLAGPMEGLDDTSFFDKVITLRADGMLSLQIMGMEIYMTPAGDAPAAPAPAPVPAADGIAMDVRYTGVRYTASGVTIVGTPGDMEYSLVFHDTGSVDLTIATMTLAFSWSRDGADYVIDYNGMPLRCTPNSEGLEMDYFGAMLLQMNP